MCAATGVTSSSVAVAGVNEALMSVWVEASITFLYTPFPCLLTHILQSLVFESTNMSGLEQVNALARLISPLHSLRILTNGNPITLHPLFLTYTLYRLAHLGLSVLNGTPVRDKDLVEAEQMFGRLSQLTTSHLPQGRLLALISRYRYIT